jgi:hypothetical protein
VFSVKRGLDLAHDIENRLSAIMVSATAIWRIGLSRLSSLNVLSGTADPEAA